MLSANLRKMTFVAGILLVMICLSNQAYGCRLVTPVLCQAYSRADAVFIGKLIKVEAGAPFLVTAHFEVKRIYKGQVNSVDVTQFSAGCGPDLSHPGEDYIVFKEAPYDARVSNLTSRVSKFKNAVKYAEELSENKPTFSIKGRVDLSPNDLRKTSITVRAGNRIRKVKVDKQGFFEFVTTRLATYKVEVSVPFIRPVFMEDLGEFYPMEGDLITYSVAFKANECSYREFRFTQP